MNLFLRTKPDDILTSNNLLWQIIQQELNQDNIILSGRRSVWLHLRQLGIMESEYGPNLFYISKYLSNIILIAFRGRIADVIRNLDPEGAAM